MAKNVFQKKKRIAHFQHAVDNLTEGENENVSSGCLDYVSSIIQNMDSNFNSVHSSCSKDHAKTNLSNIIEQRDNSSYNHHAASSSNEDFSQNPKKLSKSKKFSLPRKFPLMEKSQKILKQLKHNRSIPKPRAHLAALPKSPLKSKSVHNTCKISNAKKKKQREKGIRKLKNNAHVSILDFPDVNKNFKMSKNKISKSSLKFESCKKIGNTKFKDLNIHTTISDLCDINVNSRSAGLSEEKYGVCNTGSKDSTDDTTDGEYERFVEKSKRGLQKKVCKRQKYSVVKTSKRESRKKLNRLLRENISEEYGISDKYGNADLVLSGKKISPFKKQKFAHDALTEIGTSNVITEESEPDLNVHDCTRDSSSESDALDNEVIIANRTQLNKKSVSSALLQSESWSTTSGVLSDTILPNVNTCINEDVSETCHLTSNSIIPNKDSPGTFLLDRNHSNSRVTEPNNLSNILVIDLCDSDDDCKNTMSHTLPAVFVPKEEKCKTTDVANNLCVSEHDCTNVKLSEFHTVSIQKEEKCVITNVPQSVIQSDSEGSDLEVIKVISVFPKRSECIINNVVNSKEKCPVVHNYIKSNVDDKHSNTENDKAKSDDNKYDAVYMTNICYDFNQDKQIKTDHVSSEQSILLNNESRKQPDVLLDDYILKRTIKTENNFEDDILDSVQTSVCNSTEMNDIFINSVKNEICSDKILKMDMKCCQCQNHSDFLINIDKRNANVNEHSLKNVSSLEGGKCNTGCVCTSSGNTAFIENEMKLYEGICSNSKINHEISSSGIYGRKEDFQQMKQMSMAHLLELYKKEFQAYQEIIRTEKSVEVNLKLIETHQAEKLKYIRILVQQYVGNNQNSSETFDSSMKEKGDEKDVMFKNQDIDTIKTLTGERSSVYSLIDLSNDTENSTPSNTQKKDFFLSKKPPSSSLFQQTNDLASKVEKDECKLVELQTVFQYGVKPKLDVESSLKELNSSRYQSGEKQTLKLLKEKCNVCGKEAMAACQKCAKVFFCSHECGRKFWNDGHENECCK